MRLPSPLPVAIMFAGVLAAVAALRGPRSPTLPPGATADDWIDDRIVGVVGGPILRTAHGFGAPVATNGTTVWVWTETRVLPGERIAVTGRLRAPRGLLDPGAPPPSTRADWELSAIRIERLGTVSTPSAWIWRWAAETQAAWVAQLDAAVGDRDDPGGAALRGIVTGDRGDVPDALDQRWRAVGIFHVLSVSGLHLAVVAGLAFALLRRLFAASPWGGRIRPARWAAPPALVLAIAYTLVTGAQIATLRSLVVIAIVLIAQMIDRPVRLVDALGVAAIVVLAWRPDDLADPSFQLSFVAALTLALRPKLGAAPTRGGKVAQWFARGATTSLWVAITTAPITAFHFHQVAAGGVIGNLVLTPVVELIALPLGVLGLVVGAIAPDLGDVLVHIAAWLVGRIDDLAGLLSIGMPVGVIAVASMLVMTVLVVLAVVLAMRAHRTRLDALLWIAMCAVWTQARIPPPSGALRVTFLDVGQGDAAIVELPDGAVWVVDAGGLPSSRDLKAATAPGRAVTRALDVYDAHAIDLAIISHPHPDHYLGLAALGVPVRELWTADEAALDPAPPPRSAGALPSFGEITAALHTHVVHPSLGVARAEAGVELVVWGPRFRETTAAPEHEAADPVRTVNNNSLVVEVRFAGRLILFAGDLEVEGEDAIVAAGLGHVDVVKVAHHGSPTSSSPGFVAATHPSFAVISCGVANAFHFPSADVVGRWRDIGASALRTDTSGAITVTISASGAIVADRFASAVP